MVWALVAASGKRTPEFEAFRASLHDEAGHPTPGLDLAALIQLRGREKTLAELMLQRVLPETRAIIGLGALGTARAQRLLSRLFQNQSEAARAAQAAGNKDWSGAALIACALVSWRLEARSPYVEAVADRLRYATSGGERMDAAAALGEMPVAEADLALTEALDDRDALVRHSAARSLLSIHGVELDARATRYMVQRIMTGGDERGADLGGDLAFELLGFSQSHPHLAQSAGR